VYKNTVIVIGFTHCPPKCLACKYTSFAWSYRDSFAPEGALSDEQTYRMIKQMPSILEFYSYIFFFPSSILGPFFEFKDFILFINQEQRYAENVKGHKIGAMMLAIGIINSVGYGMLVPYFNGDYILTDEYA